MTVHVSMARIQGKYFVSFNHVRARVERGNVILKSRHLKILGIERVRKSNYVLLNGNVLAHACPDGYLVRIKTMPFPGFPDTHENFGFGATFEAPEK